MKRDKETDQLINAITDAARGRFGAGARFNVWCDTSDGDPREFDSCLHRVPLRSGPDAVLFPRNGDGFTATSQIGALQKLLDALKTSTIR